MPVIVAACLGFAVLSLVSARLLASSEFFSLAVFIALADFVLQGVMRKTPLFQRVQALVFESLLSEWLTVLVALALLVGLLMVLKLFWIWVALALAAAGVAVGLHAALDGRLDAERRRPLEQAQGLVRALRLQGHDEDALRQFVCNDSGQHWEEFFETLFGYEAKLAAREGWGRSVPGKARPRFAWWRDPVAHWLDSRLEARRAAKETTNLQKIEERSLESQGINLVTARRRARRAAAAMVATAAEIRESIRAREGTIVVNRSIVQAMREAALKPESVLVEHERGLPQEPRAKGAAMEKLLGVFFGPKVRFLTGAALLAGCIAWMHQNAMISQEHALALLDAARAGDVKGVQSHAQAGVALARRAAARENTPLDLPFVPPDLLVLVSSLGAARVGSYSSSLRSSRVCKSRFLPYPPRPSPSSVRSCRCPPLAWSTPASRPACWRSTHGRGRTVQTPEALK